MAEAWYEKPLGQALLEEIKAQPPAEPVRAARPPRTHLRQYAAAKASRLTADWQGSDSSADSELVTSLKTLRARSRQLVRDASYAKQAQRIVVNNIIGTGIGMQAQVKTNGGDLIKRFNDEIEANWETWSKKENCHTGGRLHFRDIERHAVSQLFEAGEVFIRKHHRAFGRDGIPYALEIVEAERLADEFMSATLAALPGNEIRMGVEVDSEFFRPQAYWIRRRHPNELRFGGSQTYVERVPADQIFHLAIIDRWPQTRGVPWMHAAARRLNDMDGYSEAEIIRARDQANTSGAIKTPENADSLGEEQDDGSFEVSREPGTWARLRPGEEITGFASTAPNPQLDPFMRYMLRETAAGTGVSYESLSRDYSQSNYSSSKLSVLDDRDTWRCLQWWFIREFRAEVHHDVMQASALAGLYTTFNIEMYAANMAKFEAVRFKPRGWTWVDPTREVDAYKAAVKAGFTTNGEVIAATAGGLDVEDIAEARADELKMFREKDLVFDTMPEVYVKEPQGPGRPATNAPANPTDENFVDPPAKARVISLR